MSEIVMKELLLLPYEIEILKGHLPIGAEITEIQDSEFKNQFKQYDLRAKVIYNYKGEVRCSHLSYKSNGFVNRRKK